MRITQLGPGLVSSGPGKLRRREAAGLGRDLRPARGERDAERRPALMHLLRDAASLQERMGKLRPNYSVATPQVCRAHSSEGSVGRGARLVCIMQAHLAQSLPRT